MINLPGAGDEVSVLPNTDVNAVSLTKALDAGEVLLKPVKQWRKVKKKYIIDLIYKINKYYCYNKLSSF